MARRITIDVLCDVCQSDDQEVEAEEIEPTTIGPKGKPLVMGLCKEHMEIYETVKEWLSEYGAPIEALPTTPAKGPQRATSGSGDEECKICGKSYAYIGSLRTHVKDKHHMTLAEMRGEEDPALLGTPPKTTRAECDHCDVVYEWPEYSRPAQAMGIHKRQEHGIAGASKEPEQAASPPPRKRVAKKAS